MLSADVLRPEALGSAELEAWSAFCVAGPDFGSPLLRPEFTLAVGATRPDARVAVLKRHGRTIGFFPHHRAGRGYARPIGAPFSDYHAVIAEPGSGLDPAEVLAAAGLRTFRFQGLIDPHGAFSRFTGATTDGFLIDVRGASGAARLQAMRAENPKRTKNWRRLENRLVREAGPLSLSGANASRAELDLLLGWKSAQLRRNGLHDVLRPRWVRQLMGSLFDSQDPDFRGLLITLKAGGRPVAGHFGVRAGGRFHSWISAYDPALSAAAPGIAFLNHAIPAMDELGLEVFDLGPGHDHYKRPFANRSQPLLAGVARCGGGIRPSALAATANGRVARLARRVHSRFEHVLATEPDFAGRARGLWEAALAGPRRIAVPAGGDGEPAHL